MAGETTNFPFPFKPYNVQEDFMRNLYSVLEGANIGIFESPTGTGKSLSIICGSLKWLKDFQNKQKEELKEILNEEIAVPEDDWFNTFLDKQDKSYKVQDAKKEYESIIEFENRIRNLRKVDKLKTKMKTNMPSAKRQKQSHDTDLDNANSDEDFIVDELTKSDEDEPKEKKHILKIYYASRTHSQLSQFLGEIKRSPYNNQVTVTTLGSRSNFCVNKAVSKFKNFNLINEHCIDLQRKKGSGKKCPFMRNLSDMQDSILASVRDIEEIVNLGTELKCCPYYSTRGIIPDAEIVLLPYNILLHKPTRDAYGIELKNNVVIIDEAHNLVEAINNMYSVEISGIVLKQSLCQLESYHNCYQSRFSRENLRFIKLLISVLKFLINSLKTSDSSRILSVTDFICMGDINNVNIFELVKYCDQSLIGQKVHGFTASRVAKGISPSDDRLKTNSTPKQSSTTSFLLQIKNKQNNNGHPKPETVKDDNVQYKPSAIFNFIEFLKTLTFPTKDGRILINKSSGLEKSSLKFLHLNPASHFQDIVSETRSVILAGGTMQPITEFTEQLFFPAGVVEDRIKFFSCGHVIPPENLLAIGLASGPCGSTLDFTYKNRKSPQTIKELGSIILNICSTVRGGVVCFFPSYDYEEFIFSELAKSKIWTSIEKKTKVFREPKLSSDVDKLLGEYAKCISFACSKTNSSSTMMGALLFSIVGGKMSEGINFSDNLGRCVIMVGLPYPNKFSIELQEKMSYLNHLTSGIKKKSAGDVYYNNLCMKAVNQSIGRAIRHRNDYATIVLLDQRYNNAIVKDSLPSWISKSLTFHQRFGTAYSSLRNFFISRKDL